MTTTSYRIDDDELRAFQRLIREVSGIALGDSKRELIVSRLGRRLRELGLDSFSDYHRMLVEDDPAGDELRRMVNCITTNKTDFFREPHHFELLKTTILPELRAQGRAPIRIWSAASSTGEEPYSIAMAAREALGTDAPAQVEILASDIDTDVLARAAEGVYAGDGLGVLTETRRRQHFLRGRGDSAHLLAVRPELRRMVTFQRINLSDTSWSHAGGFDVIFCRNVMIYFDQKLQRELIARFARQLRPGGWLLMGHTENLQWLSDEFRPVDTTAYRLRGGPRQVADNPAPSVKHVTIVAGDVHASRAPAEVRTILGSCVAACLFDPVAGVGGMNHFMLPDGNQSTLPNRYGIHAMELLINRIMKLGGDRRRLRAKAFGGAEVLEMLRTGSSVSNDNVDFIRRFLHDDGIPLVAERLGGTQPLEVRFQTHTGRAFVHALRGPGTTAAAERERNYVLALHSRTRHDSDDITLFRDASP